MIDIEAAATYVDISREEFEDWLSTHSRNWSLKPGTVGVYRIPLSKNVAVEVSSSVGSAGANLSRGRASMKMKMVSTVTGQTLNRKSQGQKYFTRTQNWRKNLNKGVERMKQAYLKAQGFYEAIALIEDRDAYKRDTLALIEGIDGWRQNPQLTKAYQKVSNDGILGIKELAKIKALARSGTSVTQGLTDAQKAFLDRMRALYAKARDADDTWTMQFTESLGKHLSQGGRLSDKQRKVLQEKLRRYRV